MDVSTRWDSLYDMLERYLEEQTAVMAVLMSTEARGKARDTDTLDVGDISDAEGIVKVLKPLKTATTVGGDKKQPSLSPL